MSNVSLGKLEKQLNNIGKIDAGIAAARGIKLVQGNAKMLCPVHYGELRSSIFTEVETSGDRATGICYTNKSYAPYVEFGTGPKGQKKHEGISPDAAVAYTQDPWWIHESQIESSAAEKYHWFYIDTPKGRFYQCTGQPAQPFMYPALKNNEEAIVKEIKSVLREEIRRKVIE